MISIEKQRNCTFQIFYFGKFITQICAKLTERFCKAWNYGKYENFTFSRPIFHQKRLDIANKKYLMTISMEKLRKYTSQIFYFLKLYHRDFFQTCWDIFKYHEIIKKI